jgi:formylglycine-generating enzyme
MSTPLSNEQNTIVQDLKQQALDAMWDAEYYDREHQHKQADEVVGNAIVSVEKWAEVNRLINLWVANIPKNDPKGLEIGSGYQETSKSRLNLAKINLERIQNGLVIRFAENITLVLLHVPAGTFLMGSENASNPERSPCHEVHLPDYFIGKYPVTVAQFNAFIKSTGYKTTAEQKGSAFTFPWYTRSRETVSGADWKHPRGLHSDVEQRFDHPVTLVSWDDAMEFCRWAGRAFVQSGRSQINWSVRLPSEAEWEKAARGTDERLYPWGNQKPGHSRGNYDREMGLNTVPIGYYSPNSDSAYGCVDMVSSVRQWTQSLYASYPYQQDDGREDIGRRDKRAVRGGSHDFWGCSDCIWRSRELPDRCDGNLGFRVCIGP